jgi:hypothetical protein
MVQNYLAKVFAYNRKRHSTTELRPYLVINLNLEKDAIEISEIMENTKKNIPGRRPNIIVGDYILISKNFEKPQIV